MAFIICRQVYFSIYIDMCMHLPSFQGSERKDLKIEEKWLFCSLVVISAIDVYYFFVMQEA